MTELPPTLSARVFPALAAVFLMPCAVLAGAEAKEPPRAWTPDLMFQVKQITSVQVSPNGKQVVYVVREPVMEGKKSEYLSHLHLAYTAGTGGLPLTRGDKSCDRPQWSPDGARIAFLSSRSGKRNVWVIRASGGEAQRLTDSESAVTSFKWSPQGDRIAFTAVDASTLGDDKAAESKNDARVLDEHIRQARLFVIAADARERGKPEARRLTHGDCSVSTEGGRAGRSGYDWSPDGKTIVFSQTRSPRPDDWTSADLSLVDVETATVKPLVKTPAAEFSPLYSPDGQWIAYVASDNPPTWGGAGRVHVIPARVSPQSPGGLAQAPGGLAPRLLADTHDGFGRYSELVGWSADSKKLYFTELHGTSLVLLALPLEGKPEVIRQATGMSSSGVSLNSTRTLFGFSWETTAEPPEAAVRGATANPSERTVSQVNLHAPGAPVSPTRLIHWKSADNLEIEGLLTYPAGYDKVRRYPLLLIVHGGPMGAFTQTFIGTPSPYPVAVFASRGYAVLRCNIRGSSGYGKKFRYANYGDWGGKDFQDLMAGVDHVIAQGIADPERLGVMGWSYGGYVTSWTITQTKRFKAASVGAGVTNLMSFTGTADIPSFLPDYFAGEPWDNLEAYRAHSPMFHVKGVSTPTLIQHGERDERVPLSQGLEFYNALKRQRCPVKMVVYPRTPHGIEEPKLLKDAMTRNLEWFDHYLGNQGR